VTIVVTIYRRTTYLRGAIRSALGQTYSNVEVLVTEDGGSDVASAIVQEFSDPRLRYRRNDQNVGESGNRFNAYAEARGEFLVNLDDDDVLVPEMVERLLAPLLDNPRVVVSFSDHYVARADGTVHPEQTSEPSRRFRRDRLAPGLHRSIARLCLLDATVPFGCSAVFRRTVVADSADAARAISVDDLYLAYLVSRTGGFAYYVPARLATYRVHDDRESVVGRMRMSRGAQFCLDKCLADPRLAPLHGALQRQWAEATVSLAAEFLLAGDRTAAGAECRRAFRNGASLKALAGLALCHLPTTVARSAVATYRRLRRG